MLSRDEIEKLSGRELDAAIAEHIFGWRWDEIDKRKVLLGPIIEILGDKWVPTYYPDVDFGNRRGDVQTTMPHYSSYIENAWVVVKKIKDMGYMPNIVYHQSDNLWHCEFFNRYVMRNASAENECVAICKAALYIALREEERREQEKRMEEKS